MEGGRGQLLNTDSGTDGGDALEDNCGVVSGQEVVWDVNVTYPMRKNGTSRVGRGFLTQGDILG